MLRPTSATFAPSAANSCAVQRPMPLPAPVTMPAWPANRPVAKDRLVRRRHALRSRKGCGTGFSRVWGFTKQMLGKRRIWGYGFGHRATLTRKGARDETHALHRTAPRTDALGHQVRRDGDQSARRGVGKGRNLPGARAVRQDGPAGPARHPQAGEVRRAGARLFLRDGVLRGDRRVEVGIVA